MRIAGSLLLPLLALAACNGPEPASNAQAPDIASEPAPAVTNAADPMPAPAAAPAAQWKLSEGALLLASASGAPAIRIACPAPGKLLVNVPAFRAVGSEERLSFGSGGEVVALVADTNGDKARGGVTGTGELPANLAALIAGPISASYGAQTSGRHPAPPGKLASAFAGTCRPAAPAPAPPTATAAGPCFTQGTERLTNAPLRAVGTEPFWGAKIDGRCVIYSHPEDQKGTRIWTRPSPRCSDGMSDKSYPMSAALKLGQEKRNGCAAPL